MNMPDLINPCFDCKKAEATCDYLEYCSECKGLREQARAEDYEASHSGNDYCAKAIEQAYGPKGPKRR